MENNLFCLNLKTCYNSIMMTKKQLNNKLEYERERE